MSVLYAILIVGTAVAGERDFRLDSAMSLRGWPAAAFMAGAVVVPLCWLWLVTTLCERRIAQGGGWRYIDVASRAHTGATWAILIGYMVAVVVFGWGVTVQQMFGGDIVAGDIILTTLPPLLGMYGAWWLHYPIPRRLRHASVLRAVDEGGHVPEIPSRWRFVNVQMRVQVLFLLIPLLLIATCSEVVDWLLPVDPFDDRTLVLNESISIATAAMVFLFAPLIARFVLEVRSLPEGEAREALVGICRDQRVRMRDILLWRTDGSMINAAVMGLIGPLRYVLITDALLESLGRNQVCAVMAHEVGHVRRRHLPWMVVTILAILMPPALLAVWAARAFGMPMLEDAGNGATLVLAFFAFGWISRRFERQADTFAVQHLSGLRPGRAREAPDNPDGLVTPEAAHAMQSALARVAVLNGINPTKPSWRHGSIRWRQQYLERIVGKPLHKLPIDREIRLIKLAVLAVLLASIAGGYVIEWAYPVSPRRTRDGALVESVHEIDTLHIHVAEQSDA